MSDVSRGTETVRGLGWPVTIGESLGGEVAADGPVGWEPIIAEQRTVGEREADR